MTIRIRFASGTEIRNYAVKDEDWEKTSKFIFILVFIMSVSSLQKNQTNIDSAFLIHMRAVFFQREVSQYNPLGRSDIIRTTGKDLYIRSLRRVKSSVNYNVEFTIRGAVFFKNRYIE